MNRDIRRVPPEENFEALKSLKEEGYNVLVDLTCVDYSKHPEPRAERFDVVYRLASLDPETGMEKKTRVELHSEVGEEPVLRSAAALWPIADWLEREVWDMFGLRFADRPGIKRLLMYEDFKGHPLRKDYPIHKRQPLIGSPEGEPKDNPSFNTVRPTITYE